MTNKKVLSMAVLCLMAALTCSAVFGQSAGGSVAGTVTDPKGALIAGAVITVTTTPSGQTYSAKTDQKGRFTVGNLAPGVYTVTIDAPGFVEQKRENLTVTEGKPADASVQLEIAPVEGTVSVDIGGTKANQDSTYQKLRHDSNAPDSFAGEYATVTDLVIKRDAGMFILHSGEVYFLAPVEGRTVGAVFIGDGEFLLTPPTDREKSSLAIFIDGPELKESFTSLVLRFTDQTYERLKSSAQAKFALGGPQSAKAREMFRDKEEVFRKELTDNIDLRIMSDLYAPPRPGFFLAVIGGKRFNKLIYRVDPQSLPRVYPEEVQLSSYGESDGGIWTAFHLAGEYSKGTANSAEDRRLFDIQKHEIDTVIKGTKMTATDHVTYVPRVPGQRVLPFDLWGSLRVSRVTDEAGRSLDFIQEAKDQDADFGVILPEAGEVGKTYKLTFEYSGDGALFDAGRGNFFLIPRSTWYPNNPSTAFGDRALFDLTFHYPKGNILVGVGALAEPEKQEGDQIVSHWSSGQIELQVAGYNYGRFKKKIENDPNTGLDIEYYANTELPDALKAAQLSESPDSTTTLGALNTTSMADSAIADTKNSTRIYNEYFGKIPFTRIAMSQQPAGNFGQAWPTLVYMPFTAFLDTTFRVQLMGIHGGTNDFWTYVGPHEISHQWWGHAVGWTSYHDQWMSEGFAEFSTSLYAQFVNKDMSKFNELWENQRKLITESSPRTKDRKPYTVGPVTQGYRLNNAKTGGVARAMIYPKGAYILHMIRMMMLDMHNGGDKQFIEMLKDFVQTHLNQDASTEDFQRVVEKHITKSMDLTQNGSMNWYFDQWVYGTEIPAYKFEYQITTGSDGKPTLLGWITQSGVSNNFAMPVPVYVDFGKGYGRVGSVTLVGNTTYELPPISLPAAPKRVTLCAMSDVLYTSLEVVKR